MSAIGQKGYFRRLPADVRHSSDSDRKSEHRLHSGDVPAFSRQSLSNPLRLPEARGVGIPYFLEYELCDWDGGQHAVASNKRRGRRCSEALSRCAREAIPLRR